MPEQPIDQKLIDALEHLASLDFPIARLADCIDALTKAIKASAAKPDDQNR